MLTVAAIVLAWVVLSCAFGPLVGAMMSAGRTLRGDADAPREVTPVLVGLRGGGADRPRSRSLV